MLNMNSLLLSSDNPTKLVDFYKKVLKQDPDWDEGGYVGFKIGSGFLTIGPHDKVKGKSSQPERIIINFETSEVVQEFERVKKIGAQVVKEPYSMEDMEGDTDFKIATLSDPDGNYFQFMSPMGEMSE